MKKTLALLLVSAMVLTTACSSKPAETTAPETTAAAETSGDSKEETAESAEAKEETRDGISQEMIDAARKDGELVVYGSCEEEYLAAACKHFEELYGIKVSYQRLSTGEVYAKVKEEKGNPSADVWFGGTTDPYNEAKNDGLLEAYAARNAVHLRKPIYKDADNNWFGIYSGYLGFICNKEELERLNLEAPKDWEDLAKPEYKGLVAFANPGTAGTGKLIINTIVQMEDKDEAKAMDYFKKLDENILQYPKSGAGPSKMVGPGEIVIAVGFLHDGIYQILQGYDNLELIAPAAGTSFEIGATAIFKGAKHGDAAKLWVEYALSPECVELGQKNGSYQFLVLDNATDPPEAQQFGLSDAKLIDYDFQWAAENTSRLVELWNSSIKADGRLKTE